jgi:hypothetical protein
MRGEQEDGQGDQEPGQVDIGESHAPSSSPSTHPHHLARRYTRPAVSGYKCR